MSTYDATGADLESTVAVLRATAVASFFWSYWLAAELTNHLEAAKLDVLPALILMCVTATQSLWSLAGSFHAAKLLDKQRREERRARSQAAESTKKGR